MQMSRPVILVILIFSLVLAACGGVRFLPYGEEVQTGTTSVNTLIQDPPPEVFATPTGSMKTDRPVVVTVTPTTRATVPPVVTDASEPEPLAAVEERKPYQLQPGSPAWLPNFLHPEAGCNWMGVAGQAFDQAGNPITALVVEIGGMLEGAPVQSLSLTGVAVALGPGGYEIALGDEAIETNSALWIQLKGLSGIALTDPVYFPTFSNCDRNLVLINFIEKSFEIEVKEYFVPVFYNGFTDSMTLPTEIEELGLGSEFFSLYLPVFLNGFPPEPVATPSP
jgi:hypothetical protein